MEEPTMPWWIAVIMLAPYSTVWAMSTGKGIADWIWFVHLNRRNHEGFVNPLPTPAEHRQMLERMHPVDRVSPKRWWVLTGLSILWAIVVWMIGGLIFLG